MTEPELRAAIIALADELGVRWIYFGSDVRRQQGQWAGFPDMLFCGSQAAMFAELKASGKQPRAAQRDWHEALVTAGEDIALWQPGDYLSGVVAERLAALNGQKPPARPPRDSQERLWRALRQDAGRKDMPR